MMRGGKEKQRPKGAVYIERSIQVRSKLLAIPPDAGVKEPGMEVVGAVGIVAGGQGGQDRLRF
jgi:hypothetical protein